MLTRLIAVGCTLVGLLFAGMLSTPPTPATAAEPKAKPEEIKAEDVRKAIKSGVEFLIKQQGKNGNWEAKGPPFGRRFKGGVSALAVLAMLESGCSTDEEPVKEGLRYLRLLQTKEIYVLSLQTMAYCRAGLDADRERIRDNADLLVKSMIKTKKGALLGFGYNTDGEGAVAEIGIQADNSNTNYAVMALEAGSEYVARDVWGSIRKMYAASQGLSGGWSYRNDKGWEDRLTSTASGVAALFAADRFQCGDEIQWGDDAVAKLDRMRKDNPAQRGLIRIGALWSLKPKSGWAYYNLLGFERAGRLSGSRFFFDDADADGKPLRRTDWYREAVAHLLESQNKDGSWGSSQSDLIDENPIISTGFSLIFLARASRPILINKLVWGGKDDRKLHGDWNVARHDVGNLTSFCGRTVFLAKNKPTPLNWRNLDVQSYGKDEDPAGAMAEAPVLSISGEAGIDLSEREMNLIREYVKQGGFVLVNAVNEDREFDKSFRKLAEKIWPDHGLKAIPNNHELWTAAKDQAAKDGDLQATFNVEGITIDQRLAVVYVPQDLGLHWTANRLEGKENERIRRAFRLGANIVAHAIGGKLPKEKLEK